MPEARPSGRQTVVCPQQRTQLALASIHEQRAVRGIQRLLRGRHGHRCDGIIASEERQPRTVGNDTTLFGAFATCWHPRGDILVAVGAFRTLVA